MNGKISIFLAMQNDYEFMYVYIHIILCIFFFPKCIFPLWTCGFYQDESCMGNLRWLKVPKRTQRHSELLCRRKKIWKKNYRVWEHIYVLNLFSAAATMSAQPCYDDVIICSYIIRHILYIGAYIYDTMFDIYTYIFL